MIDLAAIKEKLTPELLLSLSPEQQQELYDEVDFITKTIAYNQIGYFKPFDYQRKFYKAGKDFNIRYMRAGNRLGKTFGAAAEFAYHLTGEYPDDWEGLKIPNGGCTYWAIGVNQESTANVLQKALLGTNNATVLGELGKGSIPRRCLDLDKGLIRDGFKVKQIRVKHKSGRDNTLMFYGSENLHTLMGQKVVGILLDEQPPFNQAETVSQLTIRLANARGIGKDGFLMLTATPENGQTKLDDMFDKNEGGNLYMQQVSLDDCPLYTEEQIERLLSSVPEWERDMRRHGIPAAGQGAVFKVKDSDILVTEVKIQPHWEIIAAIDNGEALDPCVFIVAAKDPDTNTYYIIDEIYIDDDRSAKAMYEKFSQTRWRNVPIITPHDMGNKSDNPNAKGKQLAKMGLNVQYEPFRNPPDSILSIKLNGSSQKRYNDIATGLNEMRLMFEEGKLKVSDRCFNWIREKRGYQYKVNNHTGSVKYTKPDHCIDASRYAVMSLMGNRGCRYDMIDNPVNNNIAVYQQDQFNY